MTIAVESSIQDIFSRFDVCGCYENAAVYGNGHINSTYAVNCLQNGENVRYILQKINKDVFRQPEKLMENVDRICSQLHCKLSETGKADLLSRKALTLIPARDTGLPYIHDENMDVWRLYLFIERTKAYNVIETEHQAFQAARAFGEFQKLLTDLPGERLHETIPGFHDTPRRFRRFLEVLENDSLNLASSAASEIEFMLSFEDKVSRLTDLQKAGRIPERVTHNDTKLNNVLLDAETDEAVCVIDLDTAMPGLSVYDFGDLVRTSTTSTAEDEKDLSKFMFLPDMFKALTRGFLSETAEILTPDELDNLVFGGILITYETGLRFLTDYLEGSVYFKTHYPEHNLTRCRTQIALVRELEKREEALQSFVAAEYRRLAN